MDLSQLETQKISSDAHAGDWVEFSLQSVPFPFLSLCYLPFACHVQHVHQAFLHTSVFFVTFWQVPVDSYYKFRTPQQYESHIHAESLYTLTKIVEHFGTERDHVRTVIWKSNRVVILNNRPHEET